MIQKEKVKEGKKEQQHIGINNYEGTITTTITSIAKRNLSQLPTHYHKLLLNIIVIIYNIFNIITIDFISSDCKRIMALLKDYLNYSC